jgi:hypothetical protein
MLKQTNYGRGPASHNKPLRLRSKLGPTDAPYTPGNRGLSGKVKCLNRAEFVVVGWTA